MGNIKIRFEVKRILYHNKKTAFTIANMKLKEHPEFVEIPTAETVIRGIFQSICEKDEFEATGQWIDTGVNGYQFHAETTKLLIPESNKGMTTFIQKHVSGIGRKTAIKIVDTFNEDTMSVIRNDWSKVAAIEGVGEKRAKRIHDKITSHKDLEEVLSFLLQYNVSYNNSLKIYEQLGFGVIEKIRENPYLLCSYSMVPFKNIDNIAYKLGFPFDNRERVKQGILLYIDFYMKNRGDLYVSKKGLFKELSGFLGLYGSYDDEKIPDKTIDLSLRELKIIEKIKSEFNKKGEECIYPTAANVVENTIVEKIFLMDENFISPICKYDDITAFIDNYELQTGFKLAKKQREAVYMALTSKISILTGGPGTGKTQTINTIIKCIKDTSPLSTIELAAPTGRAAKRMTEMTGMVSKTIHRLIGLNNFDQDESPLIEIEADFLIVDESSMIDAFVFHSLLKSISEDTRILLVGDHEQLPSVGPGLILRDLMNSEIIPVTKLDEVFRQAEGSQIIMNSNRIIRGLKSNALSFQKNKGDFYFIEKENKEDVTDAILRSMKTLVRKGTPLDDIQVLSVMNKGDLGVIELNKKIQKVFNTGNKPFVKIGIDRILKLDDKVIQLVNNYDLDVFNGEMGKITSINIDSIADESELEVVVDYGDKEIIYKIDDLNQISLAYAITVHKSQGSEFKIIIMPIHSSLDILLNRNIIYTGWTRAKDRVVIVGSIKELDKGIDKTDNTIRNSLIKEKLLTKVQIKLKEQSK